jgi:hypothetical protein
MANNENIKAEIRMEAQRIAMDVALALLEVEKYGPRMVEQGRRFLENVYQDSR